MELRKRRKERRKGEIIERPSGGGEDERDIVFGEDHISSVLDILRNIVILIILVARPSFFRV